MADSPKLPGSEVALTGTLFSMTREQAVERIRGSGGTPVPEPRPSTKILVAGNAFGHLTADGRVARNMAAFSELKRRGAPIQLVEEPQLLQMLGERTDDEDSSRLYTAEQVSRIVEVPLPVVRSWVRRGLLVPARLTHRLAWFEFADIVTARNLSRLTMAGVPASKIHRSLGQIARWLPDGQRILSRLEAYATGLRLRLPDGAWIEPSGQRLMDFDGQAPRITHFPEPEWFARAVEAEEGGDLEAAAGLYARAIEQAPEPEMYFNLGNVFYELGREESAAERYLQAIDADHAFAEAWNNLGNALVAIGRYADGIHAYEMALSLEPGYAEPHCNLATVMDRMGQPGRALAHRAACQDAFPSAVRLTLLRRPIRDASED